MRTKKSNIRDVASLAGVSIATVSRILNGDANFSAGTIRNVERAAKELDYRRSTGSIVKARSGAVTVELVVSDIDLLDPFSWELIRGLYDTTELHSCGVSLRVFRGLSDSGDRLGDEIERSGVQGAIFIPSVVTGIDAFAVRGAGLPLVFLERTLEGRAESCVVSDGREGAYQAVRYLARLGHRSIAYLGSPASLSTEREKRAGFGQAIVDEGLSFDPANLIEGDVERAQARDALSRRLSQPRDFSALFASSDLLAFGAKEAIDRAGLEVPRDLSLIGYGDIPFSAALGLTTVSAPAYEMGRNALLLLLDHIQGRLSETKRLSLSTGLVIRSTCGRAPK